MPIIIMKLNEICNYDRRLNCNYCQIYYRCRGNLKLSYEFINLEFCPYFKDIIR